MERIVESGVQSFDLKGLQQGHTMTLIMTNLGTNACKLQFKNQLEDVWYDYPGFDSVPFQGAIIQDFRCVSARMRVVRESVPTSDWYVTVIQTAQPDF